MDPTPIPEAVVFRRLQARLTRRRLSLLDPALRVELVLLALLISGFVFWQVRVWLAGVRHEGGPGAASLALALVGIAIVLLTATLAGARHAGRLRSGPPGPAWLALPASPAALSAHLAWDSSAIAIWMLAPAAGAGIAAAGLVAWWWLLLLAAPFYWILVHAARGGARVGERLSVWRLRAPADLPPIARALAVSAPRAQARRFRPARWARRPAWVALGGKDLRLTLRVPAIGGELGVALLFWALSLCAWTLPDVPPAGNLRYGVAFVLAVLGSAALGEWLVGLLGSDPFATVRVLPLGLPTVWGARFAWAPLGAAALLAGHAAIARELSPHAMRVFLAWVGGATLAIAALAVNYGVTLFPRSDLAHRMLGFSLGLAVAASIMIPLMGWIVLAAAILHSARRLPRWSRLEEA